MAKKPNVLILMADQLAAGALPAYGNAVARTPHMDALAADGGGQIKPINVTGDFMRGGREKPTFARGSVTRLGGRVANVEAIAWQDDAAKPIAAARMNYLIVRG